MAKILLISHCVPPVPFAPSTLFKRLFKYFPVDSYIVMTSRYENPAASEPGDKLPCDYYYAGKTIFGEYSGWSAIGEWFEVIQMVAKGLSIMRREKVTGLLTHPVSGNFLLASYILNRLTGIPLYVYMLDLYTASQTYKIRKVMAAPIERVIMKAAEKVFVMSEVLQDFYEEKYGRKTVLLRHPVALPHRSVRISRKAEEDGAGKKTIVFTGMIYEAQLDALQNLVLAVNGMHGVEFHIYSQRPVEKLKSLGLSGDNIVHHGYVDHANILDIQRKADMLFLPMAFNSPYPDIIRTASPGKLPEYLASGTPVLVHAPEDAYISWYAREYGWGFVVDTPDPGLLRTAIENILHDSALTESLIESALNTVRMHEASKVADVLKSHLGVRS